MQHEARDSSDTENKVGHMVWLKQRNTDAERMSLIWTGPVVSDPNRHQSPESAVLYPYLLKMTWLMRTDNVLYI